MQDLRYRLSFEVSPDSADYRGEIAIRASDVGPTLVLDCENLSVEAASSAEAPLPFALDPGHRLLTISGIPTPSSEVVVRFRGRVEADRPTGLYVTPLGERRALTTMLAPAAARRVFPCIDRPDEKAVFELEVVAPGDLVVISNMPASAVDRLPDGRQRTRFPPTPKMSTYLLYLGVGPWEELERVEHGFRVIGASARGSVAKTAEALEVSAAALRYFSEYYGLPYPLPKLHVLAVPKFLSGAMENWGAIVATEPAALTDEHTTTVNRQGNATLHIHEVSHQWFGDLVTTRRWDDLWLNEGFATFVSYKARAALRPEWTSWEDFLMLWTNVAMVYDSLPGTHPVSTGVPDDRRATEFFDDISYGKGASVLRMLEAYVGEEAFRRGVARYLREHAWGNAEAQDLWTAIALESQDPIDRVMPPWILRPGYPMVRARAEGDELVLEQSRFVFGGTPAEEPWPVPVVIRSGADTISRLMSDRVLRLALPGPGPVVIGPGRSGFYRVLYEGELGRRFLDGYAALPEIDRWGFLDDAMAFFLSGGLTLGEYLRILARAADDPGPMVTGGAFVAVTWLAPCFRELPRLRDAFRNMLAQHSDRLGLAPRAGEPAAVASARERASWCRVSLDAEFARTLAAMYPRVDQAPADLRQAILMAYASTGGPAAGRELLERFRASSPGNDRRQIAMSLGCLSTDEGLRESLALVGSGEMQLSSWSQLANAALWFNPEHYDGFWSFITRDLERCAPRLSSGGWTMTLLVQQMIPAVGLGRAEAMREWIAHHPLPESEEAARKGLAMLAVFTEVLRRAREDRPDAGPPPASSGPKDAGV